MVYIAALSMMTRMIEMRLGVLRAVIPAAVDLLCCSQILRMIKPVVMTFWARYSGKVVWRVGNRLDAVKLMSC